MSDFLTALPIGLLLIFSAGPVFFVILETSVSNGAKQALAVSLGAVIADIGLIAIAFYSASSILQKLENQPQLYFVGGAILFFYGILSFVKTRKIKKQINYNPEALPLQKSVFFYLTKGFFLNTINISTLLFWMGATVVFGARFQMELSRLVPFFSYIILIYFSADVIKIILAKQLKNKLSPNIVYRLKQGVNIILVLFGCLIMLQGAAPEKSMRLHHRLEQR